MIENKVTQSAELGELFAALSKAQASMGPAKKDKANPFFKSKYADLASVWEAAREPLAANSLCVVQTTHAVTGHAAVRTTLGHGGSGQWISSETVVPLVQAKNNAQAFGSALTYARRYGLSAILGIAQDDDDGNAASRAPKRSEFEIAREAAEQAGLKHYPDNADATAAFNECRTAANYRGFVKDCESKKWG